jgi:hypothetical protein
LTNTPTTTPTNTPTSTNTFTTTPTNTPTGTATSTFTNTPTNIPTFTPTNLPTGTYTPTSTFTFTNTPTPTATLTITSTPQPTATPTITPALVNQQTIEIFDIRGELVLTLKGTSTFSETGPFSLSLSTFVPLVNAPGGSLNISINGVVVAAWNATDQSGQLVPNGVYHISVTEKFPDGSSLNMAQNAPVDPYSNQTAVYFKAMPNMVHSGDVVKFSASFAGIVADGQSKIKIYDLAGELIASLFVQNGASNWDLTDSKNQIVASGIYLAVLDGTDPASGQHLTKVLKILVTR